MGYNLYRRDGDDKTSSLEVGSSTINNRSARTTIGTHQNIIRNEKYDAVASNENIVVEAVIREGLAMSNVTIPIGDTTCLEVEGDSPI